MRPWAYHPARSGAASAASARARARGRNAGGSELLRIPARARDGRRHLPVHTVLSGHDKRSGCWRETSKAVSTTSVTTGWSPTSAWTGDPSKWLKAGYVESGRLFPTTAGTPKAELSRRRWLLHLGRTGSGAGGPIRVEGQPQGRKEQGQSGALCGRLHHHRQLERVAGGRSQTPGGSVSDTRAWNSRKRRPGSRMSPKGSIPGPAGEKFGTAIIITRPRRTSKPSRPR